MIVNIYCLECSEIDDDELKIEMLPLGKLAFNPETKTQAQDYKCPICGYKISIIIDTTKNKEIK